MADDTHFIIPWSKSRSVEPVVLPIEMAMKNRREIDSRSAAGIYFEFYDGKAQQVTVTNPLTNNKKIYELVSNVNFPESSAHFKIVKNIQTGHHIILAKGMDLPVIRDEGGGYIMGAYHDLEQLQTAHADGCISDQVIDAEKTYLKLLQDSRIPSLEIIGYSIGSIPANYAASVYDAKVTNIADLGVPGTGVYSGAQKFVAENFNVCAHGLFPGASGKFEKNLNENIIGLSLRADLMGGVIGEVGKEYGKQIVLDSSNLKVSGIAHIPYAYEQAAKEKFPDAPTADATKTATGPIFKPFN